MKELEALRSELENCNTLSTRQRDVSSELFKEEVEKLKQDLEEEVTTFTAGKYTGKFRMDLTCR